MDLLDEPTTAADWLMFKARAKELKLSASYVQADITNAPAVNEIITEIAQLAADAARPFTTVVHAAGVQKQGPVLDFDPAHFDWVLRVNVTGTFIVTQAAARAMKHHATGGSIILIASMSGYVSNRGLFGTAYNSSKAAVHQLCRCAAVELAEHKIRVNTISPDTSTHRWSNSCLPRSRICSSSGPTITPCTASASRASSRAPLSSSPAKLAAS